MSIPFLGRMPIYEPIRIGGDTGVPIVVGEPDSPAAQGFPRDGRASRGATVDRCLHQEADPAHAGVSTCHVPRAPCYLVRCKCNVVLCSVPDALHAARSARLAATVLPIAVYGGRNCHYDQ